MVLVAHISDLHVGALAFKPELLVKAIHGINELNPDVTIITGDLTENGYYQEFVTAAEYVDTIETPILAIPGNHDARHVGDQCFNDIINRRCKKLNLKDKGIKIIGLDSSEPDLDYGKVGRVQQQYMEKELKKAGKDDLYKIIALHHHIIPVPQTGRERNVLSDAGDILQSLIDNRANLVLSGHKHMPNVWIMGETTFATAGTASSLKLRGKTYPSYNIVNIDDNRIEIILRDSEGKQLTLANIRTHR
ncbi:MAG TPA: metallophosphoesterase [Methanobacterium sp.]|nr:MAG: metallophosphoesterase [Methanobacterium sp.]HOI71146.1 metallophosphoesterase [Methanobacterium sp.]